MNRGIGLVAYGDSDSESSGEDTSMTTTKPLGSTTDSQKTREEVVSLASSEAKDHAPEKPSAQDTISSQSVVNTRLSATDSLNRIASTNLLKQGLVGHDSTSTPKHRSPTVDGSTPSNLHPFSQSLPGTPLTADHSAAAEVLNTPTGGRSPRVVQREGISHEVQDMEGIEGHDQQSHTEQMRMLLRPRPLPGVENFGIPPDPEGEVNPDVQAKIEQFQNVKVARGIHFNQSLMKNKNFRNPRIYTSLVELVAINEIGSNFDKSEFFDFEGYGPESYATGIAETQKQAAEKLAQQQALPRSQLQFVHGTTNQAGVLNMGASKPPSSATSVSVPATGTAGTQRTRKSKWDIDDPASKRARP